MWAALRRQPVFIGELLTLLTGRSPDPAKLSAAFPWRAWRLGSQRLDERREAVECGQVFLRREVAEEGGRGDLGRFGHLLDGGDGVAAFAEESERFTQEIVLYARK
ncbi:hypothetical protein HD596_000273 [Nonomuraea jabiensis]|uniref:Uncharacterized protein n=1 Tax=Nonomuraea jabiensis TaxID=882448 RepID=A0A7W9L7I6_9ACTN|nr:hypothetical protein [Nonomuraea jabiensis]